MSEMTILKNGKKDDSQGLYKKITLEEAKSRPDYLFSEEMESYLEEIRAGRLDGFVANGDGWRGIAVLQLGPVDIEVNMHSAAQVADGADEDDMRPIISYFNCVIVEREADNTPRWESDNYLDAAVEVDWSSEEWRNLLEQDMFKKLCYYVEKNRFSFDSETATSTKYWLEDIFDN